MFDTTKLTLKLMKQLGTMRQKGAISIKGVLSLVIGTLFGTIIILKVTPILVGFIEDATGLMWMTPLVYAIPPVLMIAIFYKIFNDAF